MKVMYFIIALLCIGLLATAPIAIAEELVDPCGFISSKSNDPSIEIYHINPRLISHLTTFMDNNSTAVGTTGRYVLVVTMTNGDNLLYHTYTTDDLRRNAIQYISDRVRKCKN